CSEMHKGFSSLKQSLMDTKLTLDTLSTKVETISQHLDHMENWVEESEDRLHHTENAMVHFYREKKCDDLENRSRHSNLRIVGLPEGLEGRNRIPFVESLLLSLLGRNAFEGNLEIERFHRALRPKPKIGDHPRMILVKVLRFWDNERALQIARLYEGNIIHLLPDVSTELQERSKEFTVARKICHNKGIKFALLYPAKLRVFLKEGAKFFSKPKEAEDFL
uniref:L1 transposable element RRM domain-containing protein n=1 Tax=Latimeria chalumnae TaxID=7897 RepID=H2ZY93_LATCH